MLCPCCRNISIHAPPRGATHMARICRIPSSFQFTPLREGRRILFPPTVLFSNFNSRPSARGDHRIRALIDIPEHFNSRPSARGDRCGCAPAGRPADFNSRPSARGDRGRPVVDAKYLLISIHAPPRGATLQAALRMRYSGKFQFTPLREGRPNDVWLANRRDISIHAPPRGATLTG